MLVNDFIPENFEVRINNEARQKNPSYVDDYLNSLFRYPLADAYCRENVINNNFIWTAKTYDSFSLFTLENSELIEIEPPISNPDWDYTDKQRHIFKKRIKDLLGKEYQAEFLKPIVDFTLDCFEHYLSYKECYPKSYQNPWQSAMEIITQGYLLAGFDKDQNEYHDYVKDKEFKAKETDNPNQLCFVTAFNLNGKKKDNFKPISVKPTCNIEASILHYLENEANNKGRAKSLKTIKGYLLPKVVSEYAIRTATRYLKRDGLIGSTPNGFFYISNKDDLIETHKHHLEIMGGIQRTITIYEKRAKDFGIILPKTVAG